MDRRGSGVRVSASFNIFALRILLWKTASLAIYLCSRAQWRRQKFFLLGHNRGTIICNGACVTVTQRPQYANPFFFQDWCYAYGRPCAYVTKCYAYGQLYAQTHQCYAYGRPNITRPYANFSSLLYFMAVALNRSFWFSTVRESNFANTWCDVSKYSAAFFSKSCQFAHFLSKQEAQLLQRDLATLRVIEYFA